MDKFLKLINQVKRLAQSLSNRGLVTHAASRAALAVLLASTSLWQAQGYAHGCGAKRKLLLLKQLPDYVV